MEGLVVQGRPTPQLRRHASAVGEGTDPLAHPSATTCGQLARTVARFGILSFMWPHEDDGLGAPNCPQHLVPLEPTGRGWVCPECGRILKPLRDDQPAG